MRNIAKLKITFLGTAACALSACAMPRHQDAVFFGTDTKVALDVGVQPENGNTPSVTFGYKRREFVYMPLAEYGPAPQTGLLEAIVAGDAFRNSQAQTNAQVQMTPANSVNAQYQSPGVFPASLFAAASPQDAYEFLEDLIPEGERAKYMGVGEKGQADSYSVFATFGGNFTGGAGSTDGQKLGARIKQVFATGIAAQIAAGQGADFVNPAAPAANAKAAAAEAKAEALAHFTPAALASRECLRTAINGMSDDDAKALASAIPTALQDARGQSAAQYLASDVSTDADKARAYLRDYMWASNTSKYSAWNTQLSANCN